MYIFIYVDDGCAHVLYRARGSQELWCFVVVVFLVCGSQFLWYLCYFFLHYKKVCMFFHNGKEKKRDFREKNKTDSKVCRRAFPVLDRNVLQPQHGHKISLHLKMPIWKTLKILYCWFFSSSFDNIFFCFLTSSLLCLEWILSSLLWIMVVRNKVLWIFIICAQI